MADEGGNVPDRIDRRAFLARGAVAAAAAGGAGSLLAACSSSSPSGSGNGSSHGSSTNNGVSKATPKPGGSLTFGTEAEEQGFDPASARYDATGVIYARTVFDPLTTVASDGTIKPYLAQSVTPNADYSEWTIQMRPNVLFHDGTACDAAAIVGSLEHFLAGEYSFTAKPIEHITTTGPLTVSIKMNQPWVPFDAYLAGGIGGQLAWPIAPAMIKNPNGTNHPIGTGPFVFKDWVVNDHFTATKNPHYWRPGLPYLDSITYKPIPEAQSRDNALASGAIQAMHTDDPQSIKNFRVEKNIGYVDDSGPVLGEPDMGCILCNLTKAPFDDLRFRQAVVMAIDLDSYRTVINFDINAVSNGVFTPGSPFRPATSTYPTYNPSQAKTLVKELKNEGKSLSFTLGTTPDQASITACEFIQSELQTVGIDCSISGQQVQQAQLINDALEGQYQALLWRQFAAVDPDLNYVFWSPTEILGSLAIDMTRNNDPLVEDALQQGRRNATASVRDQAYQKVSQRFDADLPYVWLDRAVWCIATQPNVQNFVYVSLPGGGPALGFNQGTIWPTQIWLS
jgi:peptide/nickel transport system substrate-binding protein